MNTSSPKARAAALTIALSLILSVLKLSLGLIANSISLISSGVDSLLDLFMATFNYLSIKSAERPADREHSYGHGKIENLSGFIQGGVIAALSLLIIWPALGRLMRREMPTSPGLAIVVMLISCAVSFILARHLQRVARREESVALEANALNFRADVYTGAGVIAALALVRATGLAIFDPLLALLIAALILRAAYSILKRSLEDLLDRELPEELRCQIASIVEEHCGDEVGYHKLRTRRAGSKKLVDLHLVGCRALTLEEAHFMADHIEKEICSRIPNAEALIHVEPCASKCDRVEACKLREEALVKWPRSFRHKPQEMKRAERGVS